MNDIGKANNQLAFDLFQQTDKSGGSSSIFFSPLSVHAALTMTSGGAKAQTLKQMQKVLHLPANPHASYKSLWGELKESPDYQLLLANAIWAEQKQHYQTEFLGLLIGSYNTELFQQDFRQSTEPSRQNINKWVASKTDGKIPELLKQGDITPDTDLVLTNAIYFKGQWKDRFESTQTHEDLFHQSSEKSVKIPFMNKTARFGYAESDQFQMLQMPYKGDELSFVALLPKLATAFAPTVSFQPYQDLYQKITKQTVQVQVPKFKADFATELKSSLSQLGMPDAFDDKKADFSGIRPLQPKENLVISKVVHQAVVEINEEGTEAAGATAAVVAVRMSAVIPHQPPVQVRLNRPFLYMIVHQKSGAILFLGRYSK